MHLQEYSYEGVREKLLSRQFRPHGPRVSAYVSYKVDLSDNQFLHIGLFASEEVADTFAGKLGPIHKQVQEMGAKIEITKGDITHFKVASGLSLDQLTGNRQS